MDSSLQRLERRFNQARAADEPLVLATLVATRGSTYRKAGAQVLIDAAGRCEGLLSGGCLEPDLAGRAASVLATGAPRMVTYEHDGDGKTPWGLELGCEGSMDIWLTRLGPDNDWEPLATLLRHLGDRKPPAWGLVLDSGLTALPAGSSVWSRDAAPLPAGVPRQAADWIAERVGGHRGEAGIVELAESRLRLFVATPPRLRHVLVVGAGPDASPLVEFGATMGWRVTVVDHRPAYASPERWSHAHQVLLARPAEYARHLDLAQFDAAVIMSHHMPTDLACLATLAPTPIPYVGLLGPESRRRQLLADLGEATARLQGRLRAPVGMPLGGRDPQSIALAIAAELQAFFHGRAGCT